MLAIEYGLKTKLGEIFNELPDRISDSIILVCAGYSIFDGSLGWIAALLALLTAYIRILGVSLNTNAYFNGPMAKPHRMFALTVGCLLAVVFSPTNLDKAIIRVALICIIFGSIATCFRRTFFIIKEVTTK
jgi:phosphatidylglycerophosphate synthase